MERVWKGVIAQDSLRDVSALDFVAITGKRLKEIGITSFWTILDVDVLDKNIKRVVRLLMQGLRPSWYAYFIHGDRRIIVFKGKSFNIRRGSELSIAKVKNWAFKKYNILPDNFSLEI